MVPCGVYQSCARPLYWRRVLCRTKWTGEVPVRFLTGVGVLYVKPNLDAELEPSTTREGNHVTILTGAAPLDPNFVPSHLAKAHITKEWCIAAAEREAAAGDPPCSAGAPPWATGFNWIPGAYSVQRGGQDAGPDDIVGPLKSEAEAIAVRDALNAIPAKYTKEHLYAVGLLGLSLGMAFAGLLWFAFSR